MKYAGFWRRFCAHWLNFVILLPLTGLTLWLAEKSRFSHVYYFIPGLLFELWFNVYLVKRYGGTPGKLLMKIRIVKVDGFPVGYREAFLRYSVLFVLHALIMVALIISVLHMSDEVYFSLGFLERSKTLVEQAPPWYKFVNILMNIWIWSEFIIMLTNKRRRALHDFIAGTVVIQTTGLLIAKGDV